jgi:large subunit ribosomal protein L4
MAKIDVVDASGTKAGSRDLPPEIFEAKVSVPLMHQVVVAGLASIRAGTQSTKTRGDVRGGGKKPWRQKGTGRARQGSIRSPQWVGGGVAHGPHPRSYEMRVNKKMKRGALRGALTDAATSGKLAVVRGFEFDEPKTKRAADLLEALGLKGKILIVLDQPSSTGAPEKSFRNMPHVRLTYAGALGTYDVIAADRILLTEEALDVLSGSGAGGRGGATLRSEVQPSEDVASAPAGDDIDRPQPDESVPAEDQEVGE